MKKSLLFVPLLALAYFLLWPSPSKKKLVSKHLVLNKSETNVSKTLKPLFNLTGLNMPNSLPEAIKVTQEKWLRPKNLERWELEGYLKLDKEKQKKSKTIFSSLLHMEEEITPSKKIYDYAFIFGARAQSMRSRFAYFLKVAKRDKLKIKKIIFLVGQRPILPKLETKDILLGLYEHNLPTKENWHHGGPLPKTEAEAAKLMVGQAKIPKILSQVPIHFVDTPLQETKDGGFRRPNTADTISRWLETKPKFGRVLALSSNPFCGYQNAVLEMILPEEWDIETIGKGVIQSPQIEIYFDSLARWLYKYK